MGKPLSAPFAPWPLPLAWEACEPFKGDAIVKVTDVQSLWPCIDGFERQISVARLELDFEEQRARKL